MNNQVSIAKGICIILMVMAHAGSPLWTIRFVYMFHMPFFFIISGYCFKEKYLCHSRSFLIRRVKGLYLPYVKWSLCFLLMHNVFFHLHIYDSIYGYVDRVTFEQTPSVFYSFTDIKSLAYRIIVSMSGHDQLLGGYWFLKQLFYGSIIGFLALKLKLFDKVASYKTAIIGGGGILCLTIIMRYYEFVVPYIEIGWLTFFSAFYYICGILFKRILGEMFMSKTNHIMVLTIPVIAVVAIVLPGYEMVDCRVIDMPLYILASICGFTLVMSLSLKIEMLNNFVTQFLCFCGNNTLPILTWHFLSFKLVSLFLVWKYSQPIERIAEYPQMREYSQHGWWMTYLIAGVAVPLILVLITRNIKYCK